MTWDFETEPEFQSKLEWIARFVSDEVEPLDALWPGRAYERPMADEIRRVVDPLKQEVKDRALWACHIGPELGGQGYGQVKLALMNEILGRSGWAPIIFGCQAPDTGNAEVIAHYGTDEQKRQYLDPLLSGDITSCYSMTEPQGGADPAMFETAAVRDGDQWILNGWKYFSSNAKWASFFVVMAITDPDVDIYRGASMLLVPADTPGVNIVRNIGTGGEPLNEGSHALMHYEDVRLPLSALVGGEGQAFAIAQTRLGGGRIHHAMRVVGQANRALDMMCERALSRTTKGGLLGEKEAVQDFIADSYAEITQFRLYVLYVAWRIDQAKGYGSVRKDIAAVKVLTPQVLHNVVQRAIQVHGALGVSNELPLAQMWQNSLSMGIADGPSEVHRITVARQVLKGYRPAQGLWPSEWLPARVDAAREKLAQLAADPASVY
jgi:acyl-CoA dehydrogenase